MLITDLRNCKEIIAGDRTILRELLHPGKIQGAAFRYSIAHAMVKVGESSIPHALKTSEVHYILEGKGEMHIDSNTNYLPAQAGEQATKVRKHLASARRDEAAKVRVGQAVVIPPNAKQYIRNIGKTDLKLLCIVDPAWRAEDEKVF